MKMTKHLLIFSLFILPGQLSAEEIPLQIAAISEDDFLADIPNVLTISRLRQTPADAPTASTIIDRSMIEASGIIDLPEIFRLVPGFYVAQNAGFITNTNHVVSYHGLTDAYARSMQVLIDGRTIYQPLYGGVQWSEIPITIDDIDRIEVTRGPNSASYGANAFLGTINIITKTPNGSAGNQVSFNHGNGRNEAFVHHSGQLEHFDYWISAGYREDDGLSRRADFKRTNLINARGNLWLNDEHDIDIHFGYAEGEREEGKAIEPEDLIFVPRTRDIYNHFEMVKWNWHLDKDSDFYVQGYHANDHSRDTVVTASLPFPALPAVQRFTNPYEFERFDIESQYSSQLNKKLQFAIGGSIRRDRLYAPLWIGSNRVQVFDLKRLYGQLQYDMHSLITLNAGVMIENNDFTGTDTSPRASANFHLTPNQTLRLGYSEAYRTPSYLEEKFRGGIPITTSIPNTNILLQRFYNEGNLSPEKIQSREIGYLANWDHISIDAKVFNDTISDYIEEFDNTTFAPPPGNVLVADVGTFRNFGSLDMRGFETQVKLKITPDTQLLINYSRIKNHPNNVKYNSIDDLQDASPQDLSSFLLSHQFNSEWQGSLAGYYSSAVRALGDGNAVDANYRIDARIAKKFALPKLHGEISLNVQNLTDRHDKEFADYNTLRRRGYINLKLDF